MAFIGDSGLSLARIMHIACREQKNNLVDYCYIHHLSSSIMVEESMVNQQINNDIIL